MSQKQYSIPPLYLKTLFIKFIHSFFLEEKIFEVYPSLLAKSVAIEPKLDIFSIYSNHNQEKWLLPTSPEFALKKTFSILSSILFPQYNGIYQVAPAFRDEIKTKWHHVEFSMLEWYQNNFWYQDFTDIVSSLLKHIQTSLFDILYHDNNNLSNLFIEILQKPTFLVELEVFINNINTCLPIHKISFSMLLKETLGYTITKEFEIEPIILNLEKDKICSKSTVKNLLSKNTQLRSNLNLAKYMLLQLDIFSIIYDVAIRIYSEKHPSFAVYDFPHVTAALAKVNDVGFASRMEFFLFGVEIANGYQELDDPDELRKRFSLYSSYLSSPVDEELLIITSKMKGVAGIALGVERLIMVICNIAHIKDFSTSLI